MHLLFDLDGTLTDPAPGIVACIEHALREMGAASSEHTNLTRFIGPPLRETFAELLGTSDPMEIDTAIAHYRERFGDVGLFENSLYPGIPQALSELTEHGHELRVATSKPHVFAKRIIAHFELSEFFSQVYGSELSGERTDKGELIGHIIEAESLPAATTCMIGDRRLDIDGARSQGVHTIGVLWGFGDRSELEECVPSRLVANVDELVPAVYALARQGDLAPRGRYARR